MAEAHNTFVDFLADFPYDPAWARDPGVEAPGRDVAELLASGLRDRDFDVRGVEPMDYEHVIECRSGDHTFEIGATIDDHVAMTRWNVHCPPAGVGLIDRLMGKSDREDHRRVLLAIHEILSASDRIRDVRWFPRYEPPDLLRDPRPAPCKDRPAKSAGRADPSMWDRELDGNG